MPIWPSDSLRLTQESSDAGTFSDDDFQRRLERLHQLGFFPELARCFDRGEVVSTENVIVTSDGGNGEMLRMRPMLLGICYAGATAPGSGGI